MTACSKSGGDLVEANASSTTGASSTSEATTTTAAPTTTLATTTLPPTTQAPVTAPPATAPPVTAAPAPAPQDYGGDGFATFESPTHNIGCQIYAGAQSEARCDIRAHSYTAPVRPGDCDLEWGDSVAVSGDFGYFVCHGDTVFDPGAEILGYGQRVEFGGYRCDSEKTGMTCTNISTGHGFSIRRANYRIF